MELRLPTNSLNVAVVSNLRINWEGNAYLVAQLEQMASTRSLQLHQPPMIITGGSPPYSWGDGLHSRRQYAHHEQEDYYHWP